MLDATLLADNQKTEGDLRDLCQETVEAALAAGATAAEAFAARRRTREVAFEKNDLNLAKADDELQIGLRVFVGQSMAFVTTNDPASAREVARQGVTIARVSPPDPHNGLPAPEPIPAVSGLFDGAIATREIPDLTELASRLADEAYRADARISIDGIRLSVEEAIEAIHTSAGTHASASATYTSGFVMGMAKEGDDVGSFTYDGAAASEWAAFEPEMLAGVRRFAEKAVGALHPRKGRSFRGTVILPPETVGDLLVEPLLAAICADAVRKGRSPLRGKEGEQVASKLFGLRDPGTAMGSYRIAGFDREGMPVRLLDLVVGGELRTFLYDAYEARVAGRRSTGHGRGSAGGPPRLSPGLAEVLPGDRPSAELERAAGLALIVPRFSGRVEMATGDFSGVVKGGFLLDGGERIPVTETTIAGNLYDALKSVSAVSSDRQVLFGAHAYPTVVLEGIDVTAG
ncbi:MAG: TldD/PmbA family protein [Candidatus Sericytochromatia bacterium]|nr:TldD/PmbA family protein [Candidatus Tanganyikabacteria bacterium]